MSEIKYEIIKKVGMLSKPVYDKMQPMRPSLRSHPR